MKIQFLGATTTVTGSRYLITSGNTTVLVDCGLFQGFKSLRLKNWSNFPVDPKKLDAVFLTHAHLDHSGYIPLLVKQGFRGPVYATRLTIDLCGLLLPDSGYLQEEEARLANQRGYSKHHPALPLYTADDAKRSLESFKKVPWYKPNHISRKGRGNLQFEYHPAGHLPGAASIVVQGEQASIAFSGDLGRTSDPLVRAPDPRFGADYLVVESTYGDRIHPTTDPEDQLRQVVLRTFERSGTVVIPSFAVGRAQLVLHYLLQLKRKRAIPDIPVYLNSPMAAQAKHAWSTHSAELKISREELAEIWRSVRIIGSQEESVALNEKTEPSIIVAASGMATGGRILHHLKRFAPHRQNTILFAGYQAGGTRGDLMVRGAESVKIHGEQWPIRAEVIHLDNLSAHADSNELIEWVGSLHRKHRRIFITHGDRDAAEALRKRLVNELGLEASIPEELEEFELA